MKMLSNEEIHATLTAKYRTYLERVAREYPPEHRLMDVFTEVYRIGYVRGWQDRRASDTPSVDTERSPTHAR